MTQRRSNSRKGEAMDYILSLSGTQTDDCILWPFAKSQGRGKVWIDGKLQLAHRVVCAMAHGPAPSNAPVCAHSCGNGHLGCVNPRHLRWATQKQNAADMIMHGTRLFGTANGNARLTPEMAQEIRGFSGILSQRAIAAKFGISQTSVWRVLRNKLWAEAA